jgi:hypothetical protein
VQFGGSRDVCELSFTTCIGDDVRDQEGAVESLDAVAPGRRPGRQDTGRLLVIMHQRTLLTLAL